MQGKSNTQKNPINDHCATNGRGFTRFNLQFAICNLQFAILILAIAGCWSSSGREVVVYTALDSEFSQPIFDDFTAATGIAVRAKFDTESTKTVGLAEAILAERNRPRCDVFWNNEILNTLRLERQGLLEAYDSPIGQYYPAEFRSPEGLWYGFAARARVLIVNTKLVPESERPKSINDLADPRWKGRWAWPSRFLAPRPRMRPACSPPGATKKQKRFSNK